MVEHQATERREPPGVIPRAADRAPMPVHRFGRQCGACRVRRQALLVAREGIKTHARGVAASHSFSFDHRRRPETLRTAIATAFFWPTSTTSRFPRVTPV